MDIVFWLSKVIVVLSFCRISCAHYDDLLDRIRLSKSNDPEVREFLNNVLHHHADFRWIQGEAAKRNIDDQILPLRGLPLKNKRSFYSSRNGYPSYSPYGYRMSESNYDHPINDVYPYGEEENNYGHNNVGERTYRQTDNNNAPTYQDFLEEGGEPESDIASFVSDNASPQIATRDISAGKLLQQKLMLRNILYNKNYDKLSYKKDHNDHNDHNDQSKRAPHFQDTIEVQPYSEKGVLYAPGNKFEVKSDEYKKRCITDSGEEEIRIDDIEKKNNMSIEQPLGEFYFSNPHDVLGMNQDVLMEQHQNQTNCMKFKKSSRRRRGIRFDDLLRNQQKKSKKPDKIKIKIFDDGRLVKDIKKDSHGNSIVLTIKNNHLPSVAPIYLNGLNDYDKYSPVVTNLLYNKDDTLQKIDSIIKHDEATLKLNSQLSMEEKQKKENVMPSVEPLLRVGDAELFHLYEEPLAKNATTAKRNVINYLNRGIENKIVDNKMKSATEKSKTSDNLKDEKPTPYERINEIGTRVYVETSSKSPGDVEDKFFENESAFAETRDNLEDKVLPKLVHTNKRWSGLKFKKTNTEGTTENTRTTVVRQDQINRLEDQTEPTSAAEQRELGKINNNFNTQSMDSATTEKILIIPFKKSAYPIDDSDVDIDGYDKKFHVKDSKDMIHANKSGKKSKKNKDSDAKALTDTSIKEAEEVMSKLKNDLEKSIKKNYEKNYEKNNAKLVSDDSEDLEPSVGNNIGESYNDDYSDDWGTNGGLNSLSEDGNVNEIETGQHFQFRNLKFIYESTPKSIRIKRGLPDLLGMTNDEDYSEDKVDYYESNNKRKQSSNVDGDDIGALGNNKVSKKPLTRRSRKGAKVKTIIKYKRFEEAKKGVTKKVNKQLGHFSINSDIESKVNLFTNNVDMVQKRESHLPNKQEEVKKIRMSDDYESGGFNVEDKSEDKSQQANNGNELDIIEKTQAIILHVTNPPNGAGSACPINEAGSTSPPMKGGFDDNDDPGLKLTGRSDGVSVNHVNTYKMGEHIQKDDDVMEQILKLVNQFKQSEKRKQSGDKSNKDDNIQYHRYLSPYEDDSEDDIASFSHHLHKDKKAHPTNINMKNCNIKPGVDHLYKSYHPKHIEQDLQYSIPHVTREGHVSVETIADKDENSDDNGVKRVLHSGGDNPMEYIPDNLDGFKSIVETEEQPEHNEMIDHLNGDDDDYNDIRQKRHTNKNEYVLELRKGVKRRKREAETNLEDLELDNLMSPLHKQLTRHKNYYYHPYLYETFPHPHRQAPDPPPDLLNPAKPSTVAETTASSLPTVSGITATTSPTIAANLSTKAQETTVQLTTCEATKKPSCMSEEEAKVLQAQCLQDEEETPKRNRTHKHKSHKLLQDNGDMIYDSRMQHNEKTDHYLQDKNRAKLKHDMAENSIKEHEKMRNVLNGHMILKIMDKFITRLKDNENLYKRFGTAIAKKCAEEQVAYIDEFREEQSKKDIKHAQLMLHQVIMMINQIVADQVHRKTCLPLTPTLKHFLQRMVTVKVAKSKHVAEGYPLPQIKGKEGSQEGIRPDEKQGDFLFEKSSDDEPQQYKPDIAMAKKIALIRKLLHKYEHMSENCQITVEPVKDYLVQHLAMLEKLRKQKKLFHDEVCQLPEDQKCKSNTTSTTPAAGQTTQSGATATKETSSGQSASTNSSAATSSEQTMTTATTATTLSASPSVTTAAPMHGVRSPIKSFYNPDLYNYMTNNIKYDQHTKELSDKYRKLVQAADKYRRKRQIEQRLARLFGRHKKVEDDSDKSDDNDNVDDISRVAFESPVVYSFDE